MTVINLLGAFLFLLTAGTLCFMASRALFRPRRQGREDRPLRAYKYRAVELHLCHDPCESALIIAGKRILESEASALPLPGCNRDKCKCCYIEYDDRRYAQRRESSSRPGPDMQDRRRAGRDRRSS